MAFQFTHIIQDTFASTQEDARQKHLSLRLEVARLQHKLDQRDSEMLSLQQCASAEAHRVEDRMRSALDKMVRPRKHLAEPGSAFSHSAIPLNIFTDPSKRQSAENRFSDLSEHALRVPGKHAIVFKMQKEKSKNF